jgi:gliding motility-associated lipoprotein GldH
MKHGLWLLLIAAVVACSCGRKKNVLCFEYHAVPIDGWEQHYAQTYRVDTVSVDGDYDVSVGVRATNFYPFQSLWLLVRQQMADPDTVIVDTVVCTLSDKQGNEQGKGLSLYQHLFHVDDVHLTRGQSATITVSHIMRRSILPGISDVGVLVKRKE